MGVGQPVLDGYTRADMACNVDSIKSNFGNMMTFAGGAVSWQSKLQKRVPLSATRHSILVLLKFPKKTFLDAEIPTRGGHQTKELYVIL